MSVCCDKLWMKVGEILLPWQKNGLACVHFGSYSDAMTSNPFFTISALAGKIFVVKISGHDGELFALSDRPC